VRCRILFIYKALELTQPASQWVLGVKWQEREDDHYNPSKEEIKKEWRCTVRTVVRQTTEGMNVYLISSIYGTFLS
jgi:hypothetical protein